MKKWLIILVEVALLYAIVRSSFVQYFFKDIADEVSAWVFTAQEFPKQQTLAEIRRSVAPDTNRFSPSQQSYLQQITASSGQALRFHQVYCLQGDINPYIYGETLTRLCSALDKNSTRLDS